MFSRMLIRKKILYSTVLLTGALLLLMFIGVRGVSAYRQLTMSIQDIAVEIPAISKLQHEVDDLRFAFRTNQHRQDDSWLPSRSGGNERSAFRQQLNIVFQQLSNYESQLESHRESAPLLADRSRELNLVADIRSQLKKIQMSDPVDPIFISSPGNWLEQDLEQLGVMVHDLPVCLQDRMANLRDEVRSQYHRWFGIITFSATVSLLIVVGSFWFFRRSVVQPFKILLAGSRNIARGQFDYRINLKSQDELAELADALNKMTNRFVEIRNNLNAKVQERTREVVRSEQLASVGFLAAGVAHEINNPLASIAWSAEALESRLHEILHCTNPEQLQAPHVRHVYDEQEVDILRKYLKRIQDEAFRCKGITERLLDFSRLGESQRRQETDVGQSVADVIELVKHLGQYRNRSIEYTGASDIMAWISPTEFKQVVLNLLTNALDASQDGGIVHVSLTANQDTFTLSVVDAGCGMTEEVLEHLFEPFFTRRRDGRGTGLGLSITYRIVQDHAGTLVPTSAGPGQGSSLVLTMPLNSVGNHTHERLKAAA